MARHSVLQIGHHCLEQFSVMIIDCWKTRTIKKFDNRITNNRLTYLVVTQRVQNKPKLFMCECKICMPVSQMQFATELKLYVVK